MLVDQNDIQGLFSTIHSITKNTTHKQQLKFYIAVENIPSNKLKRYLIEWYSLIETQVIIHDISKNQQIGEWYDNIKRYLSDRYTTNLCNFSRFWITEMFPDMEGERFIYTDVDVFYHSDIYGLHSIPFDGKSLIVKNYYSTYVSKILRKKSRTQHNMLSLMSCRQHSKFIDWLKQHNLPYPYYFNAGMFVANLQEYAKFRQHFNEYVKNGLYKFFNLGTQPPMNIYFANKVKLTNDTWNETGFGMDKDALIKMMRKNSQVLKNIKSLHWTGSNKPWTNNSPKLGVWSLHHNKKTIVSINQFVNKVKTQAKAKTKIKPVIDVSRVIFSDKEYDMFCTYFKISDLAKHLKMTQRNDEKDYDFYNRLYNTTSHRCHIMFSLIFDDNIVGIAQDTSLVAGIIKLLKQYIIYSGKQPDNCKIHAIGTVSGAWEYDNIKAILSPYYTDSGSCVNSMFYVNVDNQTLGYIYEFIHRNITHQINLCIPRR